MPAVAHAIDAALVPLLLLVGTAAGVVGGLAGVGGGLVMIPAMIFLLGSRFGPDAFHLFKLASISTSVILAIPAAARHLHANAVLRGFVPAMVPGALLGTLAGVAAAALLSGAQTRWLMRAFGAFMILSLLFRMYVERRAAAADSLASACPTSRRFWLLTTLFGAPSGLIAGLFGVAGGIWAVPAQNLLGIELRNAIANSTVLVAVIALATSVSQTVAVSQKPSLSVTDAFVLAACLAPGAMLGGWIGADLTHRMPTRWLSLAFNAILILTGARLALG